MGLRQLERTKIMLVFPKTLIQVFEEQFPPGYPLESDARCLMVAV